MEPRVVLVTGSAGGVGRATGERFTAGGWVATGFDRQPSPAPFAHGTVGDVRDRAACRAAVADTLDRFGRLDALVNAAGVWREGATDAMADDDVDVVLDVNLRGTIDMCRAAIEPLRTTSGVIVNLSSDAGIQGNTGAAIYCASKGGVSIFTKALALELAPAGVRVNALCPGDIMSPMLEFQAETYGGGDPQAYFAALLAQYPQKEQARFIRPDEIAELIWFLAQPAATPITGALLSIDFGLAAGK